jgi:hypothetical protein
LSLSIEITRTFSDFFGWTADGVMGSFWAEEGLTRKRNALSGLRCRFTEKTIKGFGALSVFVR